MPHRADEMRRLLAVENSLRENGGIRVTVEYLRRWCEAGGQAQMAVLDQNHDEVSVPVSPTISTQFLVPRGVRFRRGAGRALLRLVCLARDTDVVFAGSEQGNGLLLGYLAARLARRPFVVLAQAELATSVADWVPRPLRPVTRWIHRRTDVTMVVSEGVLDGIVANGLPPDRVHLVPNGVDVRSIRARATERVGPAVDGPTVVGSGRLHPHKDFELLVRAHARVRSAGLDHRLLVLGEGPERDRLRALAESLGVADSVELPGFVENPHAHLGRADLFVLSSRTEGMPLVVLEALVLGVPVVATRCGKDVTGLLAGDGYGAVVEVGALDELVRVIESHLRDPSVLRAGAARAAADARRFDVSVGAEQFRRLLTTVIQRRDTARAQPRAPHSSR